MDIVDAQVHAKMLGTGITLAIMDALGIQAALFDEFEAPDDDGALHPGYRLPNGSFSQCGTERGGRRVALSQPVRLPDAGGPDRPRH